ncbi:MAG: hypothetical protein HYV97_15100 [Bdellovibrio sp.]|nr:hypothetical protein [Bdellovibrio sp.]
MKKLFWIIVLAIAWPISGQAVDVGEFDFKNCGIYRVIGLIRPVVENNQGKGQIIDYVLETYPSDHPTKRERHRKARTFMFKETTRQGLVDLDLFHDMIVETEIQLLSHSNVSNNVILKKVKGVSNYLASNDPARAVQLIQASKCN